MEVISPWTLYWILQLDTIGMAAGVIVFFGMIFVPLAWGFSIDVIKAWWAHLVSAALTLAWLIACVAAIFLPSTKSMAAIVVIPAIANNEAVQREASDLYQLAKQAIERAAEVEPQKNDAE